MTTWLITPKWRKRVIKQETYVKGQESFIHEVGFLSGKFKIHTDEEIEPTIVKGIDILHCDYKIEIVEINDECWERVYYYCDEPTKYWVEDLLDDCKLKEIDYYGWKMAKKEIIIKCDVSIERINE